MVSYTLKAGGDGQLHTEGWRRWSASHDTTTECNLCVRRRKLTARAGLDAYHFPKEHMCS